MRLPMAGAQLGEFGGILHRENRDLAYFEMRRETERERER